MIRQGADELSPIGLLLYKLLESNIRLENAMVAQLETSQIIRSNQEKRMRLEASASDADEADEDDEDEE